MTDNEKTLRNQILQLIPSGVGVYDVSGKTVKKEYLNDGYYQMIGSSRETRHAYDGTKTINAIYPDDIPGLMKETFASIAEKRMLEYSFRILVNEDEYRWLAIRANHVPLNETTERFYAAYYDIDELVRTRDKLRANEMMYNDILTYSEITHFIYYPERHRYEIAVVPASLREMPDAMDDFPESFIRYAAMSDADAESYRGMIADIDAGKDEAECIVKVRYQGKYSWYRVHMIRFPGENIRTPRAIGSAINIDGFKDAEKAFREEKLRMKSLQSGILAASCFNVSSDCNIDINNDENLNYRDLRSGSVFQEALREDPQIAYQKPETLKILLSAAEQIPDEEQRRTFLRTCSHAGMLRQYESGRREVVLEYRRYTGRGLIWVSTRIVLLPDPETGEVLAFYYTSDINEHKVQEEVAARLVGGSDKAAAYIDLKTGKVYRIGQGPNDGTQADKLGFEEANSTNIPLYVHREDREYCRKEFALDHILQHLESAQSYTIAYRQKLSAAPEAPYRRMRTTVFYLDGEKRYLVFSRTDVTEEYEQEQQQKEVLRAAAQRAEHANLAKTDFLSRMSHDIRTPLNGIIGMTALAKAEQDPGKARDYLDKIDESGHFLLGLVNDILDMSRVESGRIELHPGSYSYSEFRRYLDSVIRPLCDDKEIIFDVDVPGNAAAAVLLVDKLRFNQIFFNLLSNAVKFTPRGGHVWFSARNVRVDDAVLEADFIVRDDGIGMNAEFQKRMFEPFEQENTGSSAVRAGSGLGLAIAGSMVDLMDGTIAVESSPGKGSTFTVHFRIPVVQGDAGRQQAPAGADALRGRHILVAEDNAINGEIVMCLLQQKGIAVSLATDGRQALKQFMDSEQYYYDAILMDVRMPVMDGLEAAEAIRALDRPDAKTVPIAALTANAFEEDVRSCLKAGMDAHIAKPIEPDRLFDEIAALLRKKEERQTGRP